MTLSQKKAVNFLKPWWDVAYQSTILALIVLALLMLLVTSGLGKSSQVSFPTEMEPKIEKATSGKSSQVDLFVSSRAVSQNHRNLTKSNNIRMDVINETIDEEYKSFRVKRSLDENSDPKTDDVLSSIYVLVILSIMFLLEMGFNNVFYSDHLMQSLVHLISTLSDVREFNKTNHGLIFANTLHHSHNRQFLWTLFWLKNLTRILLVIIALSMTAHFHLSGHQLNIHTKFSIAVLMMMLLIGILGLCIYGLIWPWMVATSPWGSLMQKYAMILNKIDIARGRCVPVPGTILNGSKLSIISHFQPGKSCVERMVDALNPYTASPNIRLILDMVAYKSGLGLALRSLAFLEIDVHNNWRPFRPQIGFASPSSLEVSWKDPLAILYLIPVPPELQLHYGIEIEIEDLEKVVEIVGYQESRYFRQIWHYQHRSASVASDLGDSTLTLNPENASVSQPNRIEEAFVYREAFNNICPPNNSNIKVSVWTIIDGQLIAKSSVTTLIAQPQIEEETRPAPLRTPPLPPSKPPRQQNMTECRNENADDCEAAASEEDCVIEEEIEPPKQVQLEECNRYQRKNLFESKSLTNLKHETRKSLKRKHRLSGDLQSQNRLRKAKSMGNNANLPLKSRDDFRLWQNRPKIQLYNSTESGISNLGFEATEEESSTEHII